MSVRKRTWTSPSGESKEAWLVDYVDQYGDRHIKTFAKKRDADAHHAIVGVAVRAGTHTADSKASPLLEPPGFGWRAARPRASSAQPSPPTGSTSTCTSCPCSVTYGSRS